MTILDEIVRKKYKEVAAIKEQKPLETFEEFLETGCHAFLQALVKANWALIAECKLASPVRGEFSHGKTVGELAAVYAKNGAKALSVLTDKYFNGQLQHIAEVKKVTDLPVLRKDFIVDTYQIYEARAVKADAVLLIAAILSDEEIRTCLNTADELAMDCLVEVHTVEELQRVLQTPAGIIGINNRDLKTFTTDINTTKALLAHTDQGRLIISESGIKTAEDVLALRDWGAKGILVGEGLVTSPDIAAKTRELALLS